MRHKSMVSGTGLIAMALCKKLQNAHGLPHVASGTILMKTVTQPTENKRLMTSGTFSIMRHKCVMHGGTTMEVGTT